VILLVLGLPGRFAQWCSAVATQLARRSGETTSLVWPPLGSMLAGQQVPSILEELGTFLIANDAAHVVVSAHQPDDKLRELLIAREIPFLLALDHPRTVVADIVGETGIAAAHVVRALANSYPFLMRYDGLPAALVLTGERGAADPAAAVAAIAAHFGIAIGAEDAAALARQSALPGNLPAAAGEEDRGADLPVAGEKLIEGALSPYHRYFLSGRLDEIVWARDLFLRSDGGSPGEPIDATGGARYLVYGPYTQLPSGHWTARVVLGFSPETVGSLFVVDAVANGVQLAHVAIAPERSGVYAADFGFAITEAIRNGLEIRITVASEQAQGRLAFGHVVLQRRSAGRHEPIDGAQDFAAALEL
jgi:hypothetical protein